MLICKFGLKKRDLISGLSPLFAMWVVLSLVSCTLPKPDGSKNGDTAATFQVDKFDGELRETTQLNSFGFPSARSYNFTACLSDLSYGKKIQTQKFTIKEVEGSDLQTDHLGCLNWIESIPFNYLGQSQYIKMERTILGAGFYKGEVKLEIGINPWAHGEEKIVKVIDLKKSNVVKINNNIQESQQLLKGYNVSTQQLVERPLWIEDGRISVTLKELQKGDRSVLNFDLKLNPQVKLNTMSMDPVSVPVTQGQYKVKVYLIHSIKTASAQNQVQLGETESKTIDLHGSTMSFQSEMPISDLPNYGYLILGIKAEPVNGPQGLKSFEGVYVLGDYSQIRANTMIKLSSVVSETKNFSLSSFITSTFANLTTEQKTSHYQKSRIEVLPIEKFNYLRVGTETTSSSEVVFNLVACLRNNFDDRNVKGQQYRVSKFHEGEVFEFEKQLIKSDSNGCINFDQSIHFKYFGCQRYIPGNIRIVNEELGLDQTIPLAINPWESWGKMGLDLRYNDKSNNMTTDCHQDNRLRSSLQLNNLTFTTDEIAYSVNENLDLQINKKIQIKMEPKVLVYHNLIKGRAEPAVRLRDGFYLLRGVLVQNKYFFGQGPYVTHYEKVVESVNGYINAPIELHISDLKNVTQTVSMMMSLQVIDEAKLRLNPKTTDLLSLVENPSSIDNQVYIGSIYLNSSDQNVDLRPLNPSVQRDYFLFGTKRPFVNEADVITNLINEGTQYKINKFNEISKLRNKATFAKSNLLKLLNLNEGPSYYELNNTFYNSTESVDILKNVRYGYQKVKSVVDSHVLPESKKQLHPEILKMLVENTISKDAERKLCYYWFTQVIKPVDNYDEDYKQALKSCVFGSIDSDVSRKSFFNIEKRIIVSKMENAEFTEGHLGSINIGNNYSLSFSHSKSLSESLNAGVSVGLSHRFKDWFSFGATAGYSLSKSFSDSESASVAVNVGETKSLTQRQIRMKIPVTEFENCSIVRMNPDTYIHALQENASLYAKIKSKIWGEGKIGVQLPKEIFQGLMICSGKVVKPVKPIVHVEPYYIIDQDVSSNLAQYGTTEKNHTFFAIARGQHDYLRFLTLLRLHGQMPTESDPKNLESSNILDLFSEAFNTGVPNSPGVIRLK